MKMKTVDGNVEEEKVMRKNLYAVAAIGLTLAVVPACATKKFVRTSVGDVNEKVVTLSTSLEQTQERTRQNESRIGEVDVKADAAGRSATEARTVADTAVSATKDVDVRLSGRVNAVEIAARRLIYEVTLSEDQGNFASGGAKLPGQAGARLDQMVDQMKADPNGIFIEIEGYTDSVGTEASNERLGLERAETVKRYLHEQHQVPLHKINVISYGEENPVASNTTRAGRALNRRVVVRVLS
jgi:outer membrane protein OmpA-like peptidoglycan-associated protein